ncbi:hypothetical protein DQX05_13160 [Paenibacillus thiaminolyticus]|uniref:Uncharacterized protein n=1 Tax=Paenibacillus thiaminolyticus TaxID=49283 RepID=A0A3A3GH14_PANTH|nr:hypothetical protein DQX05_13160 [Paenibacillus thiaminolyticus]
MGDACYNLQRFTEHENLLDDEHRNDAELGRTLSLFTGAMTDIRTLTGQRDRFDLQRMWDEVSASHAGDAVFGCWRNQ